MATTTARYTRIIPNVETRGGRALFGRRTGELRRELEAGASIVALTANGPKRVIRGPNEGALFVRVGAPNRREDILRATFRRMWLESRRILDMSTDARELRRAKRLQRAAFKLDALINASWR